MFEGSTSQNACGFKVSRILLVAYVISTCASVSAPSMTEIGADRSSGGHLKLLIACSEI
jgi:hypothetical protein